MLDVAHWFMGIDTPLVSFGAGYHSPTRLPEQVPDIVDLVWKYDQFLATYSTRRDEWANTFWGDLGTLAVNRNMLRLKPFPTPENRNPEILELKGAESGTEHIANHIRNFLDCVRSRQKPAADAETLAKSTIACLLAAMSVRTGRAYRFDGKSAREV